MTRLDTAPAPSRHERTFFGQPWALANLFGVAVCPQLTYALAGGVVQATSVGELDAGELDRRLTALERESRGMRSGP